MVPSILDFRLRILTQGAWNKDPKGSSPSHATTLPNIYQETNDTRERKISAEAVQLVQRST